MIKKHVAMSNPNATAILYGPYVRGSNKKDSDDDFIDCSQEKKTYRI